MSKIRKIRNEMLQKIRDGHFDVIVVGGGATGSGIALDAASRGLKVALVEAYDFASGTSSRSTKLIHGGVRYLEQAFLKLDRAQLHLVKDALFERKTMLELAPHISNPVAIATPIYKWWQVPYYWIGLKFYDLLAGKKRLKRGRYLSRKKLNQKFPNLKQDKLKAGILYYDGQFDDARMNLCLIKTAEEQGAVVCNYLQVADLLKNDANKICGVRLVDQETKESFEAYAKIVINATGPFVDQLRFKDDPEQKPILKVSSGIHIVTRLNKLVDKNLESGMLIPETDDGRVIFVLPWKEHLLIGTTDEAAQVSHDPQASDVEIDYLLEHVNRYLEKKIYRTDVLSAWSGLRPLVSLDEGGDTANLVRDHYIENSASGLLTITGGKWTTYRKMAQDVTDRVIEKIDIQNDQECHTHQIPLYGAKSYSENLNDFLQTEYSLSKKTAQHLARTYGAVAKKILKDFAHWGLDLIDKELPYIQAEIYYLLEEEFVCSAEDILSRRWRLSFLNSIQAERVREKINLMIESYSVLEPNQKEG